MWYIISLCKNVDNNLYEQIFCQIITEETQAICTLKWKVFLLLCSIELYINNLI